MCYNLPRTPTQIHGSQYPPPGGPPPTTAGGTHPMMIGQHLTALSPEGITNGSTFVTITNPEAPVYGNTNPGSQQQRIATSGAHTDANNNEVIVSSGTDNNSQGFSWRVRLRWWLLKILYVLGIKICSIISQ